jgi:DNA-directed RNA polymerase specialized sigma24 family protein
MPAAEEIEAPDRADVAVVSSELERLSERASQSIRSTLESLPVRDRMLVRLRFAKKMAIADIARILQLPQRPLYRRLEQILTMLRAALAAAGIDARSAGDLIGSAFATLDFGLGSGKYEAARQSNGERGQV